MTIDAGNEDKPALKLAFADQAWLVAFALANLVPLLFWDRIEAGLAARSCSTPAASAAQVLIGFRSCPRRSHALCCTLCGSGSDGVLSHGGGWRGHTGRHPEPLLRGRRCVDLRGGPNVPFLTREFAPFEARTTVRNDKSYTGIYGTAARRTSSSSPASRDPPVRAGSRWGSRSRKRAHS